MLRLLSLFCCKFFPMTNGARIIRRLTNAMQMIMRIIVQNIKLYKELKVFVAVSAFSLFRLYTKIR